MHTRVVVRFLILVAMAVVRLEADEAVVNRELGLRMLSWGKETLVKEYYDPAFNPAALNQRCELAEQKLMTAASDSEVLRIVAQAFLDPKDAGVRLLPPPLAMTIDYGWKPMVVGDSCLVYRLKKDSDAVSKGLKLGDRIESINGVTANRATLPTLLYLFEVVDPQGALRVAAVSPDGTRRTLDLQAEVTHRSRARPSVMSVEYRQWVLKNEEDRSRRSDQFAEVGDVLVWRSRQMSAVDAGLSRIRKAKAVVIDFRGNGTGTEDDLQPLLSAFFDHDVNAGTVQHREKKILLVAKPGAKPYTGTVVVLVDSSTAVVPEIFTRVMQLEDRGIVVGDRTAGRMHWTKAIFAPADEKTQIGFGLDVTVARMQLRDGKSYEGVGVSPDLVVRPNAAEMAQRSDPALAKALAQLGQKLTPEEAGKLLPWAESSRDL